MITGGFGWAVDLTSGVTRQWFIGRDGVKCWADTNEPVDATLKDESAEELLKGLED